jgi:guanylate kinase
LGILKSIHLTIFIIPDSLEQVLKHLKKRNDLTEQEIQERLRVAKQEIEQGQKYEHTVINKENKLDETITAVANIIKQHLSPLVDSL